MSVSTSEKLLQLLSARSTGIVHNDDYREDLSQITESPILFPKTFAKKSLFNTQTKTNEKILLKFKSIKPPYKFTSELITESNNTIFQVKEALIKKTDLPISVPQLKFMIKSKVPNDSLPLKEITDQKELNVMVVVGKAPEVKESKEIKEEKMDIDEKIEDKIIITEETWNDVYNVLVKKLGNGNADEVLKKFKNVEF